jgi:hypothetical protein
MTGFLTMRLSRFLVYILALPQFGFIFLNRWKQYRKTQGRPEC